MSNNENKTLPTNADVNVFLNTVPDEQAADSRWLIDVMREVTGEPAVMWGPSIIGFGSYHYKYESGREGDMPLLGFSPRKGKLALYLTNDAARYVDELERVGKHQTSKACIYVKRLDDIDWDALKQLIEKTYKDQSNNYENDC